MKLKLGDFVITGIILAAALGIAFMAAGADHSSYTAVIIQNGQVIKKITLSELNQPLEYIISGKYENKIRAERGRICFEHADCPDQVCVQTGWLTKSGQVAACLPNGVLIKIESTRDAGDEVDIYLH